MSKLTYDKIALLDEIELVFPFVEMPIVGELTLHDANCPECRYLAEDLEQYRRKDITGETIRLIHQEMSYLSAKATRWILPHYLRYCLTPEAEYNRMETEYLIYHFGPRCEFQQRTSGQLSLLNTVQLKCLIHFFEWCLRQSYWREYCPQDIESAISFLEEVGQTERG